MNAIDQLRADTERELLRAARSLSREGLRLLAIKMIRTYLRDCGDRPHGFNAAIEWASTRGVDLGPPNPRNAARGRKEGGE